MKTKSTIYFILIAFGALIMGYGKHLVQKEYALSVGIVFLMFGIYKSTQTRSSENPKNESNEDESI